MSHLSTLIHRVQKYDSRGHDGHMPKAVRNLREYVEAWEDYTEEEYELAKNLYQEHRSHLDAEEQEPFPQRGW